MNLQIIAEAANGGQNLYYHTTGLRNAIDMLTHDSIRMSPVGGSKADLDINKNKLFFFSMTRLPRSSGWIKKSAPQTILVLDGDRLKHNHKIVPVDYWGRDFHNIDKEGGTWESEDRLITNQRSLKLTKYLLEIHALILSWKYMKHWGKKLLLEGKKKNVGVFFYENPEDMLRKEKAKKLSEIEFEEEQSVPEADYPDREIREYTEKRLKPLFQILYLPEKDLTKHPELLRGKHMHDLYGHDAGHFMGNIIHNSRTSNFDRRYAEQIIRAMQFARVNSTKALTDIIRNKVEKAEKTLGILEAFDRPDRGGGHLSSGHDYFYGNRGAGLVAEHDGSILLCLRSTQVNEPGTWSYPGGKIEEDEDPRAGALREFHEETRYAGEFTNMAKLSVYKERGFQYTTFIASVPEKFKPKLNWENVASKWFTLDSLPNNLHPGMIYTLPYLRKWDEKNRHARDTFK